MKINRYGWRLGLLLLAVGSVLSPSPSSAWFDETHLAIAKVAGYEKWFNAAGPDVAKLKLGDKEGHNHFVNNPRGTVVTPEMVLNQVGAVQPERPDRPSLRGHYSVYQGLH